MRRFMTVSILLTLSSVGCFVTDPIKDDIKADCRKQAEKVLEQLGCMKPDAGPEGYATDWDCEALFTTFKMWAEAEVDAQAALFGCVRTGTPPDQGWDCSAVCHRPDAGP